MVEILAFVYCAGFAAFLLLAALGGILSARNYPKSETPFWDAISFSAIWPVVLLVILTIYIDTVIRHLKSAKGGGR